MWAAGSTILAKPTSRSLSVPSHTYNWGQVCDRAFPIAHSPLFNAYIIRTPSSASAHEFKYGDEVAFPLVSRGVLLNQHIIWSTWLIAWLLFPVWGLSSDSATHQEPSRQRSLLSLGHPEWNLIDCGGLFFFLQGVFVSHSRIIALWT